MNIARAHQWKDLPAPIAATLKSANVFYTEPYFQHIRGQGKSLIYFYTDNFIVPVIVSKKLYFVYADFCTEPFALVPTNSEEHLKEYLDQVVQALRVNVGVMWIRQTPVTALFSSYPTDSLRIPFGSYVIDLSKPEEEIWDAFSTSYKKYGRQCKQAGGTVQVGGEELVADFYQLLLASMSRAEAGIEPRDYYQKLIKELSPFAKLFVAYRDNIPEASVLIVFNNAMSYTYYGGVSSSPHRGANILLYWEAIRWMKASGVRWFSFVGCRINVDKGSKYEGIQTFKERFGGELKQGFMFKQVFNPAMFRLFHFLQTARMAIKGSRYPGDIIDQELHKWPIQ